MRFLQVHTFYENYLRDFDQRHPEAAGMDSSAHLRALLADGFSANHVIAPLLASHGYEAMMVVANCWPVQLKWARENGMVVRNPADFVHEITAQQVEAFRPDVLYLSEPGAFDSRFVRTLSWKPRLVMGWRAASIGRGLDWTEFDVILSHLQACRERALAHGARAVEHYFPGFSREIAEAAAGGAKTDDVIFSGQWTGEHARRNKILMDLAKAPLGWGGEFSMAFYLATAQPEMLPAGVAMHNRGPRWGLEMYHALKSGRIVINAEIDLARGEAGNMRLFETTGVGSFLLTEYHENIAQYFTPGVEVETFQDKGELEEKIHYYLGHPDEREEIARRGQFRCLEEYAMEKRVVEFERIIRKHLARKDRKASLRLLADGNGEELPAAIEAAAGEFADSPDLLNLIGEIHFQRGDPTAARNIFGVVIQSWPSFLPAYNNLAVLAWAEGEPAKAFEHLRKGLALNPVDRDLVMNACRIFAELGEWEEVEKLILSYLAVNLRDEQVRILWASLKEEAARCEAPEASPEGTQAGGARL